MWELIEPLDEDGVYARFFAEKGEGIHHVAVATPNFDETFARAERDDGVMLSCKHSGIDIAYLDTLRDLGGDHRDLQRYAWRRTRSGRDVAAILVARNETKRARLSGHLSFNLPLYAPNCSELGVLGSSPYSGC